jgi:hypothetical protein
MRYHVHSLGKNSSSFASVYWNRIERKKNSFFSLSLSRIGSYYLIISFAFSLSLFRSFTRLTDRLNISHVINLYNHPTNRFNEKNYIQCEKYVFVILKKMANQHQLLYDVVLNVSDDVLFIYFFCIYDHRQGYMFSLHYIEMRGFIGFTPDVFVVLSIIKITCRQHRLPSG